MAQPEDFPKRRISSLLDRSRHRTLCFIFMGGNILKGECDYFFNLVARYARVLTKLVLHLKKSFQKLWPTLKLLWRFKIQECKLPSWIVHRIL
ncbi:uncharacterized protein LOC122083534 isoform X8 [Macadamia integrifolia]|uniref:uncharacterized protein LOC122083534 isoform X8 n=1 Tax=Macadamia integrifolia TaxID=60698 RepID=UPI001C4E39A7|nr:uncharacterized protein LOC122083534 isoform X8 [Macadamia integrifolia]